MGALHINEWNSFLDIKISLCVVIETIRKTNVKCLSVLTVIVMLPSILALNRDDEELTGSEDPSVLHSVVANLPVQQAYKEGKKKNVLGALQME